MPVAPVDDRGTVLYYEDTGPPPDSTAYTTLVLVHGASFHGASFRRMIPFAAEHNLRFITPNLRDYPGSTSYTQQELDDLSSPGREQQERALRARALELAMFLQWLIQTEDITPIRSTPEGGRDTGGISLLSWSAGNCQTMGLLAYADQLPKETRKLLCAYLRSYVLYEPSLASTGGAVPAGLQAIKATREPRMSLDDLNRAFSLSVSAYYPPFIFPQSIDPLPSYHSPRLALPEELDHVVHRLTPTTSRMTPVELRETVLVEVIDTYGSQNLLRKLNPAIYKANIEHALFDRRFAIGDVLEEMWPALRVHVVWCDMSVGDCVWASVLLHHRHAAADPEWRRPMTVHKLAGANHFVHWEEPERFVKTLAGII
ncbi:alpha/beta-hydrolase [Polyporus arcularius HHB13444]|uniref:Alpha/beta-hydrolase n=1 Tax=Polyporus arcularius HHB13444 TaxID=1314778 RepID=A0A5C3PN92_9APHY|nr:alpha/beta-hydrolase [Polyporus arcularius HHB13444]